MVEDWAGAAWALFRAVLADRMAGNTTVGADLDDLSMEEEEEPDPSFSRMSTAGKYVTLLSIVVPLFDAL